VLGDSDKLNAQLLPVDRYMAKRAKFHLPPALRTAPPPPVAVAAAATPAPPAAKPSPKRTTIRRATPAVTNAAPAPALAPARLQSATPPAPPAPTLERNLDDFTPQRTPERRRSRSRARTIDVDGLDAFVPTSRPQPALAPEPAAAPIRPLVAAPEPAPVARVQLFDLAQCEAEEAARAADASAAVAPPPAPVVVEPIVAPKPTVAVERVFVTEPVVAAAPPIVEPVAAPEPVIEWGRVVDVEAPMAAELPAAIEAPAFQNPALEMIERYTLAVAREPVREIDSDLEAALDDLARTARQEILANNTPKKRRDDADTPWLAPIRKAWEPPDPDEQPRPSRWAFRRRAG
jgi:hypothetical protein